VKALFIAIVLIIIASAAYAEVRPEIAPILVLNGGTKNPIESNEIQFEPDPTPAPVKAEELVLTASADPNLIRTETSSTRKMVEEALKKSGPKFICRGVGPFWILKIGEENVEFDIVGEKFLQFSAPASSSSVNSAASVTNFTAKATNGADINALIVDSQATGVACSDGMSDQQYSHSVFVNQSGKIFDGCCWMER
jgi:uncharacterized membrane protein